MSLPHLTLTKKSFSVFRLSFGKNLYRNLATLQPRNAKPRNVHQSHPEANRRILTIYPAAGAAHFGRGNAVTWLKDSPRYYPEATLNMAARPDARASPNMATGNGPSPGCQHSGSARGAAEAEVSRWWGPREVFVAFLPPPSTVQQTEGWHRWGGGRVGMGRAASYRARGAYSSWRRLDRTLGPSTGWALGLRPLSGLELLEKPGLGLWCIGFVVVGLRGPGGGVCHLAITCPRSQF